MVTESPPKKVKVRVPLSNDTGSNDTETRESSTWSFEIESMKWISSVKLHFIL